MQETHTPRRSPSDRQCAESPRGAENQRRTLSVAHKKSATKDDAHGVPPALVGGKSKDERQAEKESSADTVSKPGGYENDPDDPTNPNEVRERTLRKQRR